MLSNSSNCLLKCNGETGLGVQMLFTIMSVTGVWAKWTFSSNAFSGTDIRTIVSNGII